MSTTQICPKCNLPKPSDDYLFPLLVYGKSPYCRCINWETLYPCIALSVTNGKRLLKDANFLLKSSGPELYDWFDKISEDTKTPSDSEAQQFASKVDYPRIITSLSLLILTLQEVGKAAIAIDHVRRRQDLHYDRDYKNRLLMHGDRIDAAASLMKELGRWPPYLEKRKANLEILRQKSLYVDYDFNFGIWVDPTALGSPEDVGFAYSGAVFTGLLELLSGKKSWRSSDGLTDMMIGVERFNTFSFSRILAKTLEDTLESVQSISDEMSKDVRKQGVMRPIRFAKYIDVSNLPADQREKVRLERLEKFTNLLAPQIAEKVNKESREHFEQENDNAQ